MALELTKWTDQPTWDEFVGSQQTGHYNQGWGWGEIAAPLGGTMYRYAVLDGASIRAAVSMVSNPIRRAGRTQLYISRGPAVDNPSPETFDLVDFAIRRTAVATNALVAKVEPYVPAGDRKWPDLLRRHGFNPLYPPSQPRSVWALDLDPDQDDLLGAMKPKWRYNIRLASKKGVVVSSGTEKDIDDFYRLYSETAQRDAFYIHDKEIYAFIFQTFWRLGQFELLMARYKGVPVGAVTLVHLGRTVWYVYGASSNEHREVMAPHLLQWEAIKWSKERGAQVYDFRGVPDIPARGQEMAGVYRFKQGFGGRHVTFLEQYAKGFQAPMFTIWRGYWQGRHLVQTAQRQRTGQPFRSWS